MTENLAPVERAEPEEPSRRARAALRARAARGAQAAAVPDRVHGARRRASLRLGPVVRDPVRDLSGRPGDGGPRCRAPYEEVDLDKSIPHQFYKLWNAPTNGLYGIENEAGNVSVDNVGFLYGSAQIFLFVLAIGAFISVAMKTGAIQTGIGRLALRFRHSPSVLIIVLMAVFALGGTTEGMWEETLGLLRPARPARAGARVRPHHRRRDRLPRRRVGRARFDRQPVRHRRRLGCGGHRRQRRHRPARGDVVRDRRRLRSPTCCATRTACGRPLALCRSALEGADRRRPERWPTRPPARSRRSTGRQKFVLVLFFSCLRGHDLRLRPLGRHLGHRLRRGLPAARRSRAFYFAQATVLFIVDGGRDRPRRQARRGGHRRRRSSPARRTSSAQL